MVDPGHDLSAQPGSSGSRAAGGAHPALIPPMPSPENGNRYEGEWQQGMKNGQGRFFHLDRGQLFEGFWQDDVAKCGTMTDYGRDEAPKPTQFPIPEVGSQPSPEGPL